MVTLVKSGPRFEFYEKVVVKSERSQVQPINGKVGAILGRACGETGLWSYAVHIYGEIEGWDLPEHELESTGEFDSRDSFYNGSSIRVSDDEPSS